MTAIERSKKPQDNDGQTQTSASCAGRPPPTTTPSLPSSSTPPPPSPPGRLGMLTVDGAAAAFACRSAALRLPASCYFRIKNSAASSTRRTICRPSEKPFATLRISFRRPTYPHSGAPISPSLVSLSSPYPQQAPQTSPSVGDAPPPYVLRIPQAVSSVCALSPLCSRKLSWQARRRDRSPRWRIRLFSSLV